MGNGISRMDKPKKAAKAKKEKGERKIRKAMTIGETKLGVTMVISKKNCEKLGFSESQKTSEVVAHIKDKLGL